MTEIGPNALNAIGIVCILLYSGFVVFLFYLSQK
jgi:hypothetical protein